MKILCDVCGKEEASVFCCADEAALCQACDRRVHRANKLAGKHRRFSLSAPSAQSHPTCDICQERRGFLFCQEDRAILCRDCDASVHGVNHLTMKHNRFLLTGVRLSAEPISSSTSPEPEEEEEDAAAAVAPKVNGKATVVCSNQNKPLVAGASAPIASTTASAATETTNSASSISEYLIKMCPGWCVEDLLVEDAADAMDDFTKGNELLPFLEPDLHGGRLEATADKFPVWVPHVPQLPAPGLHSSSAAAAVAAAAAAATIPTAVGLHQPFQATKDTCLSHHQGTGMKTKTTTRARPSTEDMFMVPQISPASTPSKRPRHSPWYY